jgi:hypothetical protein
MYAQNVGINSTGTTPNPSAGLDIDFTDKGLLIPRVSLSSLTTYNPPLTGGSPTTSMLVYNTNNTIGEGYYYWDGAKWVKLLVTGNPSDAWLSSGNAGTTPANNFLGTTDNQALVFRTNNTERMRIASNGNVGIGTTTPSEKLTVKDGSILLEQTTGPSAPFIKINGATSFNMPGLRFYNPDNTINPYIWWVPRNGNLMNIQGSSTDGQSGTNYFVISETGNVGIGTTTPSEKLTVKDGSILLEHTTGSSAPLIKINGLQGSGMSGLRFYNPDNSNNQYIWWVPRDHSLMRLEGSSTDGPSGTSYFVVKENGRVGIGINNPGGQLELTLDQGRKPSTSTWTVVSDERLKDIHGPYSKGLNEILKLNPVTYNYKNVGERTFAPEVLKTTAVGFSAQEVQKVFPEAVGVDDDGYLNFNMHAILVAYVNAIKEQQAIIEAQKMEIEMLKQKSAELDNLKAEVDLIKAQLNADMQTSNR